MTRKVKILGIQINSIVGDKIKNYQKVSKLMKENADFGADIVILPELFNTGLDYKNAKRHAEPIPTEATSMFLSGIAETYNTNIIGGSIFELVEGEKIKNTTAVFDRTGKLVSKYSKIHLFSAFGSQENEVLHSGENAVIVELDGVKVGLTTCYDIRFPEIYRKLALNGAEIITCSAAWPYPRYDHWMTLNKARAIENQCFVVSSNQCGKAGLGVNYVGNSMIVDPWGDIISNAGNNEGAYKVEINLNSIEQRRKDLPVFKDRKPELY